jgi:broad specificity phosphatase PhoE
VGIKLLLIRHGESRGNLSRRWQGWLDEPLTELGREQARRLAERLQRWAVEKSQPIEMVYSSTLARAFQTASILAQSWRVPLVLDSRLRERDVGVMQGLTWPEIEVRYPELAQIIRQRWVVPALPEGETTFDLAERAWQAVEEIITRGDGRDAGGTIAIVSHGGTINAYLNRLIGRHHDMPFMFRLGNTSLSMIELQDGRPRILLVNDLCHLD